MPEISIVGFLQNQYESSEHEAKRMMEEYEKYGLRLRELIIGNYIMCGRSFTARRLQKAFGKMIFDIAWENASPRVGWKSSDCFPPDLLHMRAVIEKKEPEIVLAFGKVAAAGAKQVFQGTIIEYPHPAARQLLESDLKSWLPKLEQEIKARVTAS